MLQSGACTRPSRERPAAQVAEDELAAKVPVRLQGGERLERERHLARLWQAHIPEEVRLDGEIDVHELAERYELSGDYIRNAAIRAAFLAVREGGRLAFEHLERAVALEYREVGKLKAGGRLE